MLLSIRRGSTLEEAMAREPQAFGPMFLSMIKVAEARGGVPRRSRCWPSTTRPASAAPQSPVGDDLPGYRIIMASIVVALISIFLLPLFAKTLKDIAGKNTFATSQSRCCWPSAGSCRRSAGGSSRWP